MPSPGKLDRPGREARASVARCPSWKRRARFDCPTPAASRSPCRKAGSFPSTARTRPVTSGYICAKVRKFSERVLWSRSPALTRHPQRGKGTGVFQRADVGRSRSDLVASRFEDARPRPAGRRFFRIPTAGSNACSPKDNIDRAALAPVRDVRGSRAPCARRRRRGEHGAVWQDSVGHLPGLSEAQLIILWGVNPCASGNPPHPVVREAQKRGARLIVIDPRTTPLARSADTHSRCHSWHRRRRGACDSSPFSSRTDTPTSISSRPHARRRDAARARGGRDVRTRGRRPGIDAAVLQSRGCTRKLPGAHPVRLGLERTANGRQTPRWRVLAAAGGRRQVRRPAGGG